MPRFEIGETDFLLDGRPHQVVSGALHYFRVHPDQWADRIRTARLMGLNTIETYVAWNYHAPERDVFDMEDGRDLAHFLDLVAEEGLQAIVRPGPYICAEWTNGGLPAWLMAMPGVGIRTCEPQFLDAVHSYFEHVLPIVVDRQIDRGGPVVLVQVENEYGAYGNDDRAARERYLRTLTGYVRDMGVTVPLITCDQAADEMLSRGGLPELHKTATFGSRTAERLATLRRHQPAGPLMCMEFWNGWFDWWGSEHHVTPPDANAQDLDDLLSAGGSVNIYMVHGGTNFGLTNGANDKGIYLPIVTSYDYDAPMAEDGSTTAKYDELRAVIARYVDAPPEPDGTAGRPAPAPTVTARLDRHLPLWDVVDDLGPARSWDRLPTMDDLDQWSGLTLYRTEVTEDDGVLRFTEVRDRAQVFLDREPVGVLDRMTADRTQALPRRAGTLEVLVEDQGRVNYGARIGEPKGLIGPASTGARELTRWWTTSVDLERLDVRALADRAAVVAETGPFAGPALRFGAVVAPTGRDLFLALPGWGKGFVWFNGFLLGRYWSIGPTRTLYVPGPLVQEENELAILELTGATTDRVEFVARPELGPTEV